MCGICGFAGAGTDRDLAAMAARLARRGPDGQGTFLDPKRRVFLGHRRLSIIDLEGGAQPMATRDGRLCVVFNGEIYNHLELRRELEAHGHVFATDHSDTEVLLHGYRQWGEALPERLNGMWAFALLDKDQNRLFRSRDRFGKKPLFYTRQNGVFAFASELSSLAAHGAVRREVSRTSLVKYYAYGFIPGPRSLYENVCKLPGGYNLTVDLADTSFRVKRYWAFCIEPTDAIPKNPEEEWGERLRDILDRAVKRRLMSDAPLGVFLSGGIDSSSVTAYAARHHPGVETFSIGFDQASFDETSHARLVSTHFGTRHFEARLTVGAMLDILPEMAERLDEPMGDPSLVPTYLLCRETRKRVTVALGGDGADELFAGYDPFRAIRWAKAYSRIFPKPVHAAIRLAAARVRVGHSNMHWSFKLNRFLRGLGRGREYWNPVWLGPLEPAELAELFQSPMDLDEVYSEAVEVYEDCPSKDMVDKTLEFYTRLYLQEHILVKVDRAGMMHSLEARAPYLDVEMADFARTIPHDYKIRKGQTKYILKKALEPVLPHEIIHRPKKGFGMPIGRWLADGEVVPGPARPFEKVNEAFAAAKLAAHREGRADERLFLWNLWLLRQMNLS